MAGKGRRDEQGRRFTGDQLSTDQIAWVCRKRQKVIAHLPGGMVEGYIMGMDRYHWSLVTGDAVVYLIPKQTPLRLGEVNALASEPRVEELSRFVEPFRAHLLATHFSMEERDRREKDGRGD